MLSDYAKSHMVLVDIDKRFEAVIARHPKQLEPNVYWRIQTARDRAQMQRDSYPAYLTAFDQYVHRRLS